MRLAGKIAIVTGGMSGIGAAIAARFTAEGATVVAADIAEAATHRLDVADEASCTALVARVMAEHGRLDCLVNSAGIGADIPFLDTPAATFDHVIAVNLRGTFLIGQACARVMGEGGAIVNIASVSGLRGNPGRVAYGASKGGVITLSQVMATELAPRGIRVNVIAPGPVHTPLVERMQGTVSRDAWLKALPMGRYATPDEIAVTAAFLCSSEAAFITGHVLAVDGGFLAGGVRS